MVEIEEKSKEEIIASSFQELALSFTAQIPSRPNIKVSSQALEQFIPDDRQRELIEAVTQVSNSELAKILIKFPPKVLINANENGEVELEEIDPGRFTFVEPQQTDKDAADLDAPTPPSLSESSEAFQTIVASIRNFLNNRTIKDNFGTNHKDRRNPWESSVLNTLTMIDNVKGVGPSDNNASHSFAFKQELFNNRLKGTSQLRVEFGINLLTQMTRNFPSSEGLSTKLDQLHNQAMAVIHKLPQTTDRAPYIANIARRALKLLHDQKNEETGAS